MNVAIRVDAAIKIGAGHLMRCLTLADELKNNGDTVQFICRDHDDQMYDSVKNHGHNLVILPCASKEYQHSTDDPAHAKWLGVDWEQDANETIKAIKGKNIDCIIVDHYGIDYRWHQQLRNHIRKIMIIDDLADRKLDCDLLLDQAYGRQDSDYHLLVPDNCRLVLGQKYALLRPEFSNLRKKALERREQEMGINKILIFMGSSDPDNVTGKVLDALAKDNLNLSTSINVVLGSNAPYIDDIKQQVATHPLHINIQTDVTNMAELMLYADLAIGSTGSSSWERCSMALPSLVTILAENQKMNARMLEKVGAVYYWNNTDELLNKLQKLLESDTLWKNMVDAAAELCDGLGRSRVAKELFNCVYH